MSGATAIDTNVLVRLLVGDDPAQARRALALLEAGPVWIPRTVLLETVWVLRRAYGLADERIQELIAGLLAVEGAGIEARPEVERALAWWRGGLDFADALHLAASAAATRFVTFDRTLVRRARPLATRPPVVPA